MINFETKYSIPGPIRITKDQVNFHETIPQRQSSKKRSIFPQTKSNLALINSSKSGPETPTSNELSNGKKMLKKYKKRERPDE